MAKELMKISDFVPGLKFNDEIIRKINYNTNRRTGTDYLFVKTDTGITYVLKYSSKGVKRKSQIEIPSYDTKKERKEIIKELYSDGYKQTDIAFFMDISQATVSKALSKKKKLALI